MPAAEGLQQLRLWQPAVKLPAPSGLPALVLTQPQPAPVAHAAEMGIPLLLRLRCTASPQVRVVECSTILLSLLLQVGFDGMGICGMACCGLELPHWGLHGPSWQCESL